MALTQSYHTLLEHYCIKYGVNTFLLMQVGSFFEVYSTSENGSNIMAFSQICDLKIANKNEGYMAGFRDYMIEKYPHNNNYTSKKEMNDKFYKPLFQTTYHGLQIGGHYIINVCKEVYDTILKELFGEAHDVFPLKKSKRQNDHTELVYVWKK